MMLNERGDEFFASVSQSESLTKERESFIAHISIPTQNFLLKITLVEFMILIFHEGNRENLNISNILNEKNTPLEQNLENSCCSERSILPISFGPDMPLNPIPDQLKTFPTQTSLLLEAYLSQEVNGLDRRGHHSNLHSSQCEACQSISH